jgi:hypothetical protein
MALPHHMPEKHPEKTPEFALGCDPALEDVVIRTDVTDRIFSACILAGSPSPSGIEFCSAFALAGAATSASPSQNF